MLLSSDTARHMAVGQNQWYHVGVGAPPILVYFSGDWDVHWGHGILTHGHVNYTQIAVGRLDSSEAIRVRTNMDTHPSYSLGKAHPTKTPSVWLAPMLLNLRPIVN